MGAARRRQYGGRRCSREIGGRGIGHAAMQTPKSAQMQSTNARKRNDGVSGFKKWRLGKEATPCNARTKKTGIIKRGWADAGDDDWVVDKKETS